MFVVTILLALAISAIWTVPARADDESPPPPETSEPAPPVEQDTGEEAVPAETQPAETPAEEAAPAAGPAVDAPVEEILAQIPEGTEVVVVNAEGEVVPLAAEEAAEVIAVVDPVWCPVGVAPQNGTGGCTNSYGSLKALVDALMAGTAGVVPGTNGVIWIAAGADGSAGPIVLDGSDPDLGSMETFSLTLKGGWNNIFGSTVTNPATPSTFTQSISIINWLGDITLSDIQLSGVTGAGSTALTVETTKKITLTRVEVKNNQGAGAKLNNAAGGTGTGDVLITASKFNQNANGTGLEVDSRGSITLSDVIADNNGVRGASLDNSTAPTAKNVTLTAGANEFNYNADNGIEIFSKGAIMLKDIDVIGNGDLGPGHNGGWFDNTWGTAPITMTGTNVFSENAGGGVAIFSNGAVTINNFIAISNPGGSGAYVNNASAVTAQPVTFTGSVQVKMNMRGLYIESNGAVTLNNVTANNNGAPCGGCGGVYIDNAFAFTSPVSVLGTNIFRDNGMTGLTVYSNGAVTLSNITSVGNGFYDGDGSARGTPDTYYGYGVYIDNTFAATPQNVTFTGTNLFGWNALSGLEVYSEGSITGSNLSAYANGRYDASLDLDGPDTVYGFGALLDNCGFDWGLMECLSTGPAKPITLTGTNTFNNNFSGGIWAVSYGAIAISNLTANDNSNGLGAYLNNQEANPLAPQNVTLTGSVNLFRNGHTGMNIWSLGAISAANVTANENGQLGFGGGGGVYLDNCVEDGGVCTAITPKPITVSGTNNFHNNLTYGLRINSKGAVTLNDINSSSNGLEGLSVDNSFTGAVGGITLNGSSGIYDNGDTGVSFWSRGLIKINNLDSGGNYGYGAWLDNTYGSAVGVTLTGKNYFWNNWKSGLEIYSNGAVSLSNVDTGNNGWDNGVDPRYGHGVYVDNSGALTPQAVTLTGWNNFDGNFDNGLEILSRGAITLSQINAINTVDGAGVVLENRSNPLLPQNVTLSGFGDFHWNWDAGLVVFTYGTITLNNVRASNNGAEGAYLNNWWGSIPKAVTLNGTNEFYNNGADGLDVLSLGAITVRLRESSGNFGNGVVLNNGTMAGSVGGVTLVGNGCDPWGTGPMYGCIQGNAGNGLDITSRGAITLTMVLVRDNGGHGARIDNTAGTGGVTFTITGGQDPANRFYSNGDYGIWVTTNGAIVAAELRANNNGTFGALLDNDSGVNMPVTLTGLWVAAGNNHGGTGLEIQSRGAVTLNNLNAWGNGWYDDNLDQYFGYGVLVNNSTAATPQNVTINGTNNFNDNWLSGLEVYSRGAITVNNVTAEGNGRWDDMNDPNPNTVYGYGVILDNCLWNGSSCAVTIPKGITLNGTNNFNNNNNDGLWATSFGLIKGNNFTANWNGERGAYLDNQWGQGSLGGITLTGTNAFENNGGLGLETYSHGAITMNNLNANWNVGGGAYLDNRSLTTASVNITLTGVNYFLGNGDTNPGGGLGLEVWSDSTVTLNNITASWNEGDGVYLNNYDYWFNTPVIALPNVKVIGVNTFYANGGWGLYVDSHGAVDLTKVTADNNGDGVYVGADGNITVTCGSMTGNAGFGWSIGSLGTVTLKGVFAFGNGTNRDLWNASIFTEIRTCPLP